MATEDEREIYRQRFESERSWYRLEWQLFQVGVAIGLVTLGLGDEAFKPEWWQLLIGGAVFVKFSYAMQRISKGFRENREKLRVYASRVGDCIPKGSSKPLESAAVRSRLILHTVGVILVIAGVWIANCIPVWVQVSITVVMSLECIAWLEWQINWIGISAQLIRRVIYSMFCIVFILAVIATAICLYCARKDVQENDKGKSCQTAKANEGNHQTTTPTAPNATYPNTTPSKSSP